MFDALEPLGEERKRQKDMLDITLKRFEERKILEESETSLVERIINQGPSQFTPLRFDHD